MAAEKDPVKYFKSEIKRLNYYNSQFLKEDDFLDEQLYHSQMRYLHNRALHTWGVVEGLEVKQVTGGSKVTVSPGIAIDRLGRELVLPAQTDAIALDSFAANARVYVTASYGEAFDQADKDTQSDAQSAGKFYTRATERPEVNTATRAPAADAPEVVLAVVVLDKDKAIAQIDTSPRRYTGSRFGSSADGKEFGLYADGAGVWHFSDGGKGADRLTIDDKGNVGVGRSPAGARLDVNGEVRSAALRIADGDGNPYPDQWIGMANNIYGSTKWLHVGGITDAGERRLTLQASLIHMAGSVGIGVATPRTALDTGKGLMSGAANDYVKAQFTVSGGGTVTWGGVNNRLKWTRRFIAISMGRTPAVPNGHVNINMPTSDIPADNVYDGKARSANAEGVVLTGWDALYAVHNVGGTENDTSFRIVRHTVDFNAPSNWILVGVVNGDDSSIKLGTGVIVSAKSSVAKGSGLPCGAIVMWSGRADAIPDGWALCDGRNGTPDLRNRFVVGAGGNYGVGDQGGQETVRLTEAEMPSHTHTDGKYDRLMHLASGEKFTYPGGGDNTPSEPCLIHTGQIPWAGGNQPHENRPPYYALCHIMKLF
jgi:hypothetical protein